MSRSTASYNQHIYRRKGLVIFSNLRSSSAFRLKAGEDRRMSKLDASLYKVGKGLTLIISLANLEKAESRSTLERICRDDTLQVE